MLALETMPPSHDPLQQFLGAQGPAHKNPHGLLVHLLMLHLGLRAILSFFKHPRAYETWTDNRTKRS